LPLTGAHRERKTVPATHCFESEATEDPGHGQDFEHEFLRFTLSVGGLDLLLGQFLLPVIASETGSRFPEVGHLVLLRVVMCGLLTDAIAIRQEPDAPIGARPVTILHRPGSPSNRVNSGFGHPWAIP
jgi:hypothetical protein